MSFLLLFLFVIYFNITNINSARILAVFPTPSISHQIVFGKLTQVLARRGHELTVITTDPIYPAGKAPPNVKEIDVHDISYNLWKEELKEESFGKTENLMDNVNNLMQMILKIVKIQLASEEVQNIVTKKNGDYDLLILEAWVRPILIFAYIYKVPVILVSSFGAMDYNWQAIGAGTHPLLYPKVISKKVYNLSLCEQLQQLYDHILYNCYFKILQKEDDEVLNELFNFEIPSISKLYGKVHMLFLNQNPLWIINQPVPINVVSMERIHLNLPKQLPKDLETYLDSSINGVIYFSLGTNVNPLHLPEEKKQMIIKVLSQLPYDVLLKWNEDKLPGKSKNIKIFKWLPQSDLLRHPNVKLFITQGGLQSTDESINAGVPLIGIPMMGDQWFNVAKYSHHKIGMSLDLPTLTEDIFRNSITTVINNSSYRENIIRLRLLIEDQPQLPLDRAVWWIEHVLRHNGAAHLRAPGANMTWMEYFEIELLVTVAFVFVSVFSIVIALFHLSLNLFKQYFIKIKIKLS